MELSINLLTGTSPPWRALFVGMMGPLLQSLGVVWDLLSHAFETHDETHEVTLNHVLFAPEHLVIAAGFLITLVCIPLTIQMVQSAASSDEAMQR